MISALVCCAMLSSAPVERLVVGFERHHYSGSELQRYLKDQGAVEVRRLSFAVVVDIRAGHRKQLLSLATFVEPEVVFPWVPRSVEEEPLFPQLWHLHGDLTAWDESRTQPGPHINVEGVWQEGVTGDGVVVAVIDDGFDLEHPDLAANLVPGFDLSDYDDPCDLDPACDDDPSPGSGDRHGTQTAGVVGAALNGVGTVGVCPDCRLLPVRLIGHGGPASLYSSGSAAALAIELAVDAGAAIINNSWGPPDGNPFDPDHTPILWPRADDDRAAGVLPEVLTTALRHAVAEGRGGLGTIVLWSSGNGNELMTYDAFASDPRVLAIGSLGADGERAYYSDYGPGLFLVAPSSDTFGEPKIVTTDVRGAAGANAEDHHDGYGGTSASAAMVAGAAALILDRYPTLTAAQVTEALAVGASGEGYSNFLGFGQLDVAGAMAAAAIYDDECSEAWDTCGDGLDNDCDGETDEDCDPCVPDNTAEICDASDNDCDGEVNEGFVCVPTDRPTCAPCNNSDQCRIDARCRGVADDWQRYCLPLCDASTTCPTGFDCDGEVCNPIPEQTTCAEAAACDQPEACDGLDNDCNGIVDDVDTLGPEAASVLRDCMGVGVCSSATVTCERGVWQCLPNDAYELHESLCDGLDNDCDGAVDEPCREPENDSCYGCSGSNGNLWPWLVALLLRRRRCNA